MATKSSSTAHDSGELDREWRRVYHSEQTSRELERRLTMDNPSPTLRSLSGRCGLASRGNSPLRLAALQQAQQTHGNRAVQRFIQRSVGTASNDSQGLPIQRSWFSADEYDEYGLKKPHKSWTEKAGEYFTPDADDTWYEEIGKGFAAIPAVIGGHILDNNPITGGVPILGEIAHEEEKNRYREARAAKEAEAKAKAEAEAEGLPPTVENAGLPPTVENAAPLEGETTMPPELQEFYGLE